MKLILLLVLPAFATSKSIFGIADDLRGVLLDTVTIVRSIQDQFSSIETLIKDVENGVIHLYYWGTQDEDIQSCAQAILDLEQLIEEKKDVAVDKKKVNVNALTKALNTLRSLLSDKSYFETKGRIGSLVAQVVPKIEEVVRLAYPDS